MDNNSNKNNLEQKSEVISEKTLNAIPQKSNLAELHQKLEEIIN